MKKILPNFILYLMLRASLAIGQCTASYSFAANSETVNFANLSNVPNAHYFWNFGDGTGSNALNPVHTFPETGKYLVTLFAKDTISNCSTFYESRLNIIKLSNDVCQPDSILDSISTNGSAQALYLNLIDNSSVNCNSYSEWCEAGVNSMLPSPAWLSISGHSARYVSRIKYSSVQNRAVYKTITYRYNSAKNYNTCSANFEFKVVSQDANGQRILFTAMNKTAIAYKWMFNDVITQITSTNDTLSSYFPYNVYNNRLFTAYLLTTGSTGCKDTLIQTILVRDPNYIPTGLKEHGADQLLLKIYPIPSQDKITVRSEAQLGQLILLNSLGQKLYAIQQPTLEQVVDISKLAAGIYFLRAENQYGQAVFKFIKE